MCFYFALTGSLLRGVLRRLFNDLVDWVVFGRRSFCPTDIDNLEKNNEQRPWFQRVDRRRGQQLVQEGGNGCFVVRPSTKHMMTLTLWFNGRTYNIPIRKRDDGQYSLGTWKPNERVFSAVDDLVDHYSSHEDLILFSKGVRTGRCRLRIPARPAAQDHFRNFLEDESDAGDLYLNLAPADQCVIHL